ncbi:MAG: cupredoxin domain-containing protein [Patescibacteria group bacterium]|mgnify:FL=1
MNKNFFIGLALGIFVLVGGFVLFKNYNQSSYQVLIETNIPNTEITEGVSIMYTAIGFSPSEVTLKNGGKITWINKGNREIKIGVNPHPIHTGNREISGGDFTLDLMPGDQKTVVILKTGTFDYHDHLNAGEGGTIIVQ